MRKFPLWKTKDMRETERWQSDCLRLLESGPNQLSARLRRIVYVCLQKLFSYKCKHLHKTVELFKWMMVECLASGAMSRHVLDTVDTSKSFNVSIRSLDRAIREFLSSAEVKQRELLARRPTDGPTARAASPAVKPGRQETSWFYKDCSRSDSSNLLV